MSRYLLVPLLSLLVACGDDPPREGRVTTGNNVPMRDMGAEPDEGSSDDAATDSAAENNGESPDVGNDRDMASGAEDAGDVGMDRPDVGDSLPSGEVCPYTDLEPFTGLCDPVRVSGCAAPEECLPAVRIIGPDAFMSAQCSDASNNTLSEGEGCDGTVERCAPGLACITLYKECRKLCYPDTSLGCDPGEFCRRPSRAWQGLGFCDSTCNL